MVDLVLHLGSNLGNSAAMLQNAIELLEIEFGKCLVQSQIYKSAAWGVKDQPDFLNQAIVCQTNISPEECLRKIKDIELKLGRKMRSRWTEREIDIDIIFYGNQVVKQKNLEIPHKEMTNRMFVLKPLNEVIPDFVHPVLGQTVTQLLDKTKDTLKVEIWKKN